MSKRYDATVIGGGILGANIAYWLSALFTGDIALLEMEESCAVHTSGRNTGVIHRPFYLDPEKRKNFAKSAQISYGLWKKYAELKNLPWHEIGTIEVATKEKDLKTVEKYMRWALANGMKVSEVEYLTGEQVKKIEPNVECLGAIYAKTDTSADFKAFTQSLAQEAVKGGVEALYHHEVSRVDVEKDYLKIYCRGIANPIESRFLINAGGGNSIDICHAFGVGLDYTDLHFRGEYWVIDPAVRNLAARNIYTVPKHPDIPFLDPHWIVKADRSVEIGPNAVMVAGSKTYQGFFTSAGELLQKIFEKPVKNKINLFTNPEFLKLASEEWLSSVSKKAMLRRIQRFIPKLETRHLLRKGTAGVRSSVIDTKGNFIKEAIEIAAPLSYHITNYNSPGATGAPAYTAHLLDKLMKDGSLSHMKKRPAPAQSFWNFHEIVAQFN